MKSKKFLNQKRNIIFRIKKCKKKEKNKNDSKYSIFKISKLIFEFIKEKNYTNDNEIKEYIFKTLNPDNNEKIQKAIQQKVNKSIIIMNSIGIIQKTKKKEIIYNPLKGKIRHRNYNLEIKIKLSSNEINSKNNEEEARDLHTEYLNKMKQLIFLRLILIEKYFKLKNYEIKNNKKEKDDDSMFVKNEKMDEITDNVNTNTKNKKEDIVFNYLKNFI